MHWMLVQGRVIFCTKYFNRISKFQLNNTAVDDLSLPPITTQSYALEFQRVIEETSQGREVLTIQVNIASSLYVLKFALAN